MTATHIHRVAIVGASGNVGSHITNALLRAGQHSITAITREDSTATFPPGVEAKRVNYARIETLVQAMASHDALVITLSGGSPFQEIEGKLVLAAGEAGVPWILPNEWSPDSTHEGCVKDVFLFEIKAATRELIEKIGKSNFIGISTGFWYEYSLAVPNNFGFNFAERKVQFYDDGNAKISTSTWPQIGRAVAALLSLPMKAEGTNHAASLEIFKNKVVYINSFTISQRDMLASACRVTSTTEVGWSITSKSSREMYDQGMKDIKEKNWHGSGNFLYGRIFFPDGCGNFESRKGTLNELLGLPKEDLDDATRVAVEEQRSSDDGN